MEIITNISSLDPVTLELQDYSSTDDSLISSFTLNDLSFTSNNIIEYHIYDFNKNLISSDINYKRYSLIDNNLNLDIQKDLTYYGFEEGQYKVIYNFLKPRFNSSKDNYYYITEISSDRTELRLSSTIIDSLSIENGYNQFISESNQSTYYLDFYLNFDNNNLLISNNVLLDNSIPGDYSLLIKLYEPLPNNFTLNSQLWISEKISDSIAYSIENIISFPEENGVIKIKGPNFNIPIKDRINNSTEYYNSNTLNNTTSTFLSNQLSSLFQNNSIELNIDYTDYENFIHFSSAQTRLENFYYKLSLLETYYSQSNTTTSSISNTYISSSNNILNDKITNLITNFDEYEYFLYYNSGSKAWPKTNSTPPYINAPTTSSQGQTWYDSQIITASLFDNENKDALVNTIPLYLREDPENDNYILFVQMLGQHFDNIYLYHEEVSNKYNADNRLDHGISRDLISDALKDFGIKIYQNNFSTDDLYSSFLGYTSTGGLLPPTGSDLITTYITASDSSNLLPLNDVNNEIYKRIYHNLPYLLKTKGTLTGLRTLINLYGIPDTILDIKEYGGKDKNNYNDWDKFQNKFNYEFDTLGRGYVQKIIPEGVPTSSLSSIEFRFKTKGIPSSSINHLLSEIPGNFYLVLEYTGSSFTSSSYGGSIPNLYNNYGTLKFINSNNNSASIYLPLYNEDWWSLLITYYNNTSSLYIKNKIYEGNDGYKIGFQSSSSLSGGNSWITSSNSQSFYLSIPLPVSIAGKTYRPFTGSFQELRFYNTQISESVFDDFVMNPYSIEGNQLTGSQSSLSSLIFRAPLGTLLDNNSNTSRTSSHPSYTNFPITESFITASSSIYTLNGSYSFIPNREIIYQDQFPSGIKNAISDKIKIIDNILPEGDVLSPFISIQQKFPISESYTKDTNYVEVTFSPQNEINDDIISQYGYFNIGDYIGDPRQLVNQNLTSYPDFNKLRDTYFSKYQNKYNLKDYIRLIKYFDNSLFKIIKDFIPSRTNLASGITIKQHLLERNRYSPAQLEQEFHNEFTSSIKSYPYNYNDSSSLYKFEGETGGVFPNLSGSISSSLNYPGVINITQSWVEEFDGPKGLSYISHSYKEEFYNGELKGSQLKVISSSLSNGATLFNNIYPTYYIPILYKTTITNDDIFFNPNTSPHPGEILIYSDLLSNINIYNNNNIYFTE